MTRLAARDVHLTDWRWQLGTLRADFATRSLAQATAFLTDVSPLLDGEATVPVVQVNRDRVLITLKDPSEGVTRREAELAELRAKREAERTERRRIQAEADAVRREIEAFNAETAELELRAAQKAARDARYAARKQRRK